LTKQNRYVNIINGVIETAKNRSLRTKQRKKKDEENKNRSIQKRVTEEDLSCA